MHDNFESSFINICNENLLKTESLFVSQKEQWLSDFEKHFISICTEIVRLQNEANLAAISYIEYTMLYTNFISRNYKAEVWVYGDDHYCDKCQCMVGEYDISFLFSYFDELWESLISERKRYINKVSAKDVVECMLRALPSFYSYLASIVRFAIIDCIDEKPFTNIVKNDMFELNVGDYMAKTKPVYTLNRSREAATLVKQFMGRMSQNTFEDCSELDFSGCSFKNMKFLCVQFRNSILNNVKFNSSVLLGSSFYGAQMENSSLYYCAINGVTFSYAQLKNADFKYASGNPGLPKPGKWWHAGHLPVNFCNADLTNADFYCASLKGADFRNATLTGANFAEAVLDNAIFSTRALPLSEEQMSKIIIDQDSSTLLCK